MTRSALVFLLVLGVGLAGCSDGGKSSGNEVRLGDGSSVALRDASVTEGKGSISGVVVDEAIRPLANISVAVLGGDGPTVTDDGGLFVVIDLEPGLYTLTVNGTKGYLPIQTTAEVRAGEVSKVRIVLPTDTSPQPYHTTMSFEWFDEAGVVLVDFAIDLVGRSFLNGTLPPACDRCYFYFGTDGPAAQILLEAVWEDTVAPPDGPSTYYWVIDGYDSGEYEDDYCASPCYVPVPMGSFGNETHYGFGYSADEGWITFQQKAQIFVSVWYLAPPPEGWSVVAGDT